MPVVARVSGPSIGHTAALLGLHATIHATKMRIHTMHIEKTEIIATLRSRGLHARADWVDRELPRLVDTYKNDSLLRTLDIDPAAMSPVEVASQQG
ncbi:hypothetical protein [Micromonospora kangleipakensis]|uniref:hypothetical protein n=1 Tax=Micromonospora kangleipakensis TaxID=1077942 RepID=UPI001F5FF006|nr:hypothetical protein [Micromonospora kangleipakensis]